MKYQRVVWRSSWRRQAVAILVPAGDPNVPRVDGDCELLELLFVAANAIESMYSDCDRLVHEWQRVVRINLSLLEMPSMSVGDVVEFAGDESFGERTYQCDTVGWRQTSGDVS